MRGQQLLGMREQLLGMCEMTCSISILRKLQINRSLVIKCFSKAPDCNHIGAFWVLRNRIRCDYHALLTALASSKSPQPTAPVFR
jgi:hypothetical protein